jgi:hypothetical protein
MSEQSYMSPAGGEARPFAVPPRLHVVLTFMTQFITCLLLLGIAPSELQSRGVSKALSWVFAALALVAILWIIGLVGRLVPVRCAKCRGAARYRGLGWWPFIYWYDCRSCNSSLRIEVGRR